MELQNIVPICLKCNQSMKNHDMIDFINMNYPNNNKFNIFTR